MSCAPYWPGAAGSLTFQQLQYTGSNKALTLTPYGNTVTLSGFVESVAAGSNIAVTGTALNPTINLANNTSYQTLGSYSGTATGAGAQAFLEQGGNSNIPVVAGGVYALQGAYNIETNGTFGFTFLLNNGANDTRILEASTTPYNSGGIFDLVPFAFNVNFVAAGANIQLLAINSGGAGGGDFTQINVQNLQLVRLL